MRYFLENFERVHNKEWPFGQFPAWEWYKSTGTHIGTDFKVPVGTPIFAPVDGEMFKTEYNRYKGNVGVYIFKHKGTEWGLELCHLRELPPKGMLNEGKIIAYSGMTGEKVDGAHLHAVLHRDAMVTKHYRELQSRDAFLRLQKEAAIVDCFEWFCMNMKEESSVEKPQLVEKKKDVDTSTTPAQSKSEVRAKQKSRNTVVQKIIIGIIIFVVIILLIGIFTNWFGLT